jgi:tetratricopeptide (TPR) repeat protein
VPPSDGAAGQSLSGDKKKAIADYTHAIELDPKIGESYSWCGQAYKAMGDLARAEADKKKALELGYTG